MIELIIFGIMSGLLSYELIYWKQLRSPDNDEIYDRATGLSDFFRNAYLGFPFSSTDNDYVRLTE